jgi:hypothetical protein
VNVHGTRGRFWSSSTANFTRFLHEHGLTVSNAIPLCDGELGHWGGETDVQRAEKYARFRAFIDIVLTCNENVDQRP